MLKHITNISFLPRWIILVIDLMILLGAISLAYLLRFNFDVQEVLRFDIKEGVALFIVCNLLSIFFTQSYAGIIRYTSIQDGVRIVYTTFLGTALSAIISTANYFYNGSIITPLSVLIISLSLAVILLFSYRVIVKSIFSYYSEAVKKRKNIMIFGAGQYGLITKQVIEVDRNTSFRVLGFLDDDVKKVGKVINGVPIYSAELNLPEVLQKHNVKEIIIAIAQLSVERKNELVDKCLKYHVKVRSVPPPDKWVNGELSLNQIREVKIEDLLGRESIKLNNPKVDKEIKGKTVLISGAAGSIGSEIAKQVLKSSPKELVILDQAESFLYEIDLELQYLRETGDTDIIPVVLDVNNKRRLRSLFNQYKPDMVYHAAAYKHVPLMEMNPFEAVSCNVLGTKNLADLAVEFGAEKFVMVSTDKAVNPTNIMGATKRIAEIYVQSLNDLNKTKEQNTKFVITRFGNVLGSNGSVIPLFKSQIEKGGPLTVTHPNVTRYFMTIPEACQLVIEAGVMGNGGEIFVFDMGKSIKIVDLAEKMIRLSGYEVGVDIKIKFTGLRDGEKLYEELLSNQESTLPTHHNKIMIAKTARMNYGTISTEIEKLKVFIEEEDEMALVAEMKAILPEFISNSSRFEVLDKALDPADQSSASAKWKISRKIS